MRKLTDYLILQCADSDKFEKEVEEYGEDGWELHGPMQVLKDDTDPRWFYTQVVVKYVEEGE